MPVRVVIAAASMLVAGAGLLAGTALFAGAAWAEPLSAEAARRFVLGKTFAYSCFDGTRGSGRIFNDGSAVGTIQSGGGGPTRMAALPPGSLRVKGDMVCATLRGMPIDPCFNLTKTDANSFRGAISGLGFAYCDFTARRAPPAVRTSVGLRPTASPLKIEASRAGGAEVTGSVPPSGVKAVE